MKFLKKFSQHADYTSYMASNQKVFPNVSYCVDNNDVHYNPWTDPRVIAKFNVSSTSEATKLSDNASLFTEIEIDGVVQPSVVSSYTFDTTGEHTVKYTLVNPTTIGNSAFYNCSGLTSITIPNSVTSIGNSAFERCTGLTGTLTIPNSVTTIGGYAFLYCPSLTGTLTIPNSVTTIGEGAFWYCGGLTSITIPNSVTTIGYNVFSDCTNLTSITIPNSVTSIAESAFSSCTSLESITVDSGNSVYDSRDNCNAIIETATNTLIQGCANTSIPNNIISIADGAFCYCTGFTSINIPNSVTAICDSAFMSCSNLTSITIPDSVTSIGDYAFYDCSSLTTITIQATTPPTLGDDAFSDNASGRKIYVPSSSVATYKAASGWSTYASDIEAIPSA